MTSPVVLGIWTIVLVYVMRKLAMYVYKYVQTLQLCRRLPGLPGTGLLQGDMDFNEFEEHYAKCEALIQKTQDKVLVVWLFFLYPLFSLTHPDTAKVLLKSHAPKPTSPGIGLRLMQPWIGDGILAHPGGKMWERNRHLLTPAFHFDILKNYVITFNEVADDFLIRLSKAGTGKSIEISQPVTVASLDALLRCACSYHGKVQEQGRDHPYVEAVHQMSELILQRIHNPLVYTDFVYKRTPRGKVFYSLCDYVHKFSDEIIVNRKETLLNTLLEDVSKRRIDFLDILLTAKDEAGKGMTDLEIRSEVDTFLFAGHDTTSASLTFAIYALAKYPDVQQKVYDEVMEVVGTSIVKWECLKDLKFLQCFIKEVMRMYSVVPSIQRELNEPLTIEGVTVPAGSYVEVFIHMINHNPAVWHDHQDFRPERFIEHNPEKDPFSYIPFSAGSRNCIGQNFAMNEQKVLLARLLQAFRIELDARHVVTPVPRLVMRAKDGVKVLLHSRK